MMSKRILDLFLIVSLIIIWWIGSFFFESYLLPSPFETFKILFGMLNLNLFIDISHSIVRLIIAYTISLLITFTLSMFAQINGSVQYCINTIFSALIKVPNVAYITFFLLFIGIGTPTIITTIIVTTVPITGLALNGILKNLNKDILEISVIYNVPFLRKVFYFYLPTVFDSFYPIYTMSISFAFKVMVMTEFIAGMNGLGYKLVEKKAEFDMSGVIAYIIIIVLIGIILQKLIEYLYRKVTNVYSRI